MKNFKKLISFMLSAIMVMGMSVTISATEKNSLNEGNTSTTIITNPDEIAIVAENLGLQENPDEIVEIIISDIESSVNKDINTPSLVADFLNPEEYEFTIYSCVPDVRGSLLRSSDYSSPGGQMTVSETVEVKFTSTAGLSAKVVSAGIGFEVGNTVIISDTQNIEVPAGEKRTCTAYVKLAHYKFRVIGKDIWEDDNLGTGTVDRPVGVIFVITK